MYSEIVSLVEGHTVIVAMYSLQMINTVTVYNNYPVRVRVRVRSRGRVIGVCVCVEGQKTSCLSELDTFMDCFNC